MRTPILNNPVLIIASVLALFAAAACSAQRPALDERSEIDSDRLSAEWSAEQRAGWLMLIEELEVQELHAALSKEHQPAEFYIENVNVITMATAEPLDGQTIFVTGGRIASMAPTAAVNRPMDATAYDGSDMWLIPGLMDMHVHNLDSHSQHLLNLAMGVTTVRDLAGFPFLLEMKKSIEDGALLAPRMFVSGTILNGSDFGGYARKLETPEEAREAVREQAAAGYDLIKTHNSLSVALFDAITDEAAKQNLDVVGHIPVPVSVEHAVASGMRTFEHFKGYIDDSTLTLSKQDYVTATRGGDVWNTPTFSTYRNHLRGAEAAAVLARQDEMQFVSPVTQKKWNNFAAQDVDEVTALRQNIYPMSQQIFAELRTLDDTKFLAGTDSGSYELLTPGFILLEELGIFQELGMTPYEALQTATVNAAEAMRATGAFGVIAPGASADFVLLRANPLDDIANLHEIEAVGMRGVWLDKDERADMLAQLKAVYANSTTRMDNTQVTARDLDDFAARLAALHESGFVFRDHYLDFAASMYGAVGRNDDAAAINAMKADPEFGFSWFKF